MRQPLFTPLFTSFLAASLYAADTPFDLIRPVYPMVWDASAVEDGGTVYDFANFNVNEKDVEVGTPAAGAKPEDFKANAYIADTLNQAFIDALNLKVGNIRVNQAGYLPDDPEKLFYYVSDKCETATYSVVDLDGKELAKDGAFARIAGDASYRRIVKAYANDATVNRYSVELAGGLDEAICAGKLAEMASLPTDQRLRIKVGKQFSSTFIVSDKVYSMVRDATLKFFGAQRSGDSESWFHGPSHLKDSIPGGWYDAGDYLKEGPTMTYAFMVLSALATIHPERDDDHYAYNHGEIVKTDGIPDILREARHGAEFFLRSYEFAKGEVKDMAVTVGDDSDHNFWDRPENMESRADAPTRPLLHGIGPKYSGAIAAGLAFLSQSYATYDKTFADSCLKVAEKLYAYGREYKDAREVCDMFYPCTQRPNDNLAMAAIALHYATYEKSKKMEYMTDLTSDKDIQDNSTNAQYAPVFAGGWLGVPSGFYPGGWPNDYENANAITLYVFYKLFLADSSASKKYGLSDSLRVDYTERTIYEMVKNVAYGIMEGESTITLPYGEERSEKMSYSGPWYNFWHFAWGPNGYDAGAVMTMLAYAEMAEDVESKKTIKSQAWNYSAVRQIAVNKMNTFLGMNRWDISFVMGVGDKNEAHPHCRMANPEFWNGYDRVTMQMLPVTYSYRPPVGAFMGGSYNDTLLSDVEKYAATETALSGTTTFLAASVLLAADHPIVSPQDTTKKDSTKTDSTKTDTTKTDTTKTDSTKGIADMPGASIPSLEVVNHGSTLDVNYVLPISQNVKVSLVSVTGKVQMQYNPGRQAAGSHALQWNVENVPAGAYILAYSAGSTREYKIVKLGR